MNLSQLKPPKGQKHKKQRIGQGMGTGRGKYSGRGAKGAKSISGYRACADLKAARCRCTAVCRSAASPTSSARNIAIVNVGTLETLEGDTFDPGNAAGTGRDPEARRTGLKILASASLTRKITVQGARVFKVGARKRSKPPAAPRK